MWTPRGTRVPERPKAQVVAAAQPKLPGTIKQVRGATYPPLMAPPPRGLPPAPNAAMSSSSSPSPPVVSADASLENRSALVRSLVQTSLSSGRRGSPTANGGVANAGAGSAEGTSRGVAEAQRPAPTPDQPAGSPSAGPPSLEALRAQKFRALLSAEVVDLRSLRETSWGGIPPSARAVRITSQLRRV